MSTRTPTPAQVYHIYAGLCHRDTAGSITAFGFRAAFDFLEAGLRHQGIEGFTIQQATGVWNGVEEESIVVTVVSFGYEYEAVAKVCAAYKAHFKQEGVLLTKESVQATLI